MSLEGFSDSDEVFPKEMTKWNSNDFIDAFAPPTEAESTPGKGPPMLSCLYLLPLIQGLGGNNSHEFNGILR